MTALKSTPAPAPELERDGRSQLVALLRVFGKEPELAPELRCDAKRFESSCRYTDAHLEASHFSRLPATAYREDASCFRWMSARVHTISECKQCRVGSAPVGTGLGR